MSFTNEFNNLPLIQVDLKLTLDQPKIMTPLTILSAGEFMSSSDYKSVDSDMNTEIPPGVVILPDFGPNTVDQVRFVNQSKSMAVTLHTQMVAVKWFDKNNHAYPRFAAMKNELEWAFKSWDKSKDVESTPVSQISYQNFIDFESRNDHLWFLDQDCIRISIPELSMFGEIDIAFTMGNVDARISLKKGLRAVPGKPQEGLVLQTIVGKLGDEDEPWSTMVDICHDKSNELFAKILSQEAKDRWGYTK